MRKELYWIHPDVRLSVDTFSGTFWKNQIIAYFIWYIALSLMIRVSWPFFCLRIPIVNFGPLLAKYLSEMGIPDLKILALFIWYMTFSLYGVSLLTPDHFSNFPTANCGSLVAKYLPEMGFSECRPCAGQIFAPNRFPNFFQKLLAQFIWYLEFIIMG